MIRRKYQKNKNVLQNPSFKMSTEQHFISWYSVHKVLEFKTKLLTKYLIEKYTGIT